MVETGNTFLDDARMIKMLCDQSLLKIDDGERSPFVSVQQNTRSLITLSVWLIMLFFPCASAAFS